MENRKIRRKIIDSTIVPRSRRAERPSASSDEQGGGAISLNNNNRTKGIFEASSGHAVSAGGTLGPLRNRQEHGKVKPDERSDQCNKESRSHTLVSKETPGRAGDRQEDGKVKCEELHDQGHKESSPYGVVSDPTAEEDDKVKHNEISAQSYEESSPYGVVSDPTAEEHDKVKHNEISAQSYEESSPYGLPPNFSENEIVLENNFILKSKESDELMKSFGLRRYETQTPTVDAQQSSVCDIKLDSPIETAEFTRTLFNPRRYSVTSVNKPGDLPDLDTLKQRRVRLKRPSLETKDPYSIELEMTRSARNSLSDLFSDVASPGRRTSALDKELAIPRRRKSSLDDDLGSLRRRMSALDNEPAFPRRRKSALEYGLASLRRRKSALDNSLFDIISMHLELSDEDSDSEDEAFAGIMEGPDGKPKLLSVEEKWQIIFNEKTRAPIYAVTQYLDYLSQFVNGKSTASRDTRDVIKKDGINPISYLLRKLKLDMKMSYDSFVEEFLKPSNNGMALLVKLLKSIQNTGSQQSGSTNMTQLKNYKKTLTDEHDCLLCIKFALRIKSALPMLLEITYGLEMVAMSLLSTFTKSRGTAIEILTVSLSAKEGFSRALDCFTFIRLKIGEPVRFKSLMNMMNLDSQQNVIFRVSCMKFLNSLLDGATNMNIRVYLQHELESAGLDVKYMSEKTVGTGLEYDDLRQELDTYRRRYISVDDLISSHGSGHVNNRADQTHQQMVEDLQRQVQVLSMEKYHLERQLTVVSNELSKNYEELHKQATDTQHAATQCEGADTKSVSCQCDAPDNGDRTNNSPVASTLYIGPKGPNHNEENAVYYFDRVDITHADDADEQDEDGVDKVQQWLTVHCDSEDGNISLRQHTNPKPGPFKRNSINRSGIRRTDFPGNWHLIPKSIEQFPSRFQHNQCHTTNCDRCDLRCRPENKTHVKQTIEHSLPVKCHPQTIYNIHNKDEHQETKSTSSDSAIGGSGEPVWNDKDRNVPLLPNARLEAQLLQDMIQPDDSASGCPESEPSPDYSTVASTYGTQKSYSSELSKVLRDFEGSLSKYEASLSHADELHGVALCTRRNPLFDV